MNKGQRERLKAKNAVDNWSLKENPLILTCTKCKKYNTILHPERLYMNCAYCDNPNYIKQ
jgi:hypothetical protein